MQFGFRGSLDGLKKAKEMEKLALDVKESVRMNVIGRRAGRAGPIVGGASSKGVPNAGCLLEILRIDQV